MEINDFLEKFADIFDDTDASEIKVSTAFHELDEWSSLSSMGLIAMVRTEYGKALTSPEIRSCATVEDLFNLVKNK